MGELVAKLDLESLGDLVMPPARGRRAAPLSIVYTRDLTEADVKAMWTAPKLPVASQQLVKLRNTHHMLARLLAEGRPNEECSLITGYTPSRISVLKQDPAFQELVIYYEGQTKAQYLDVHARLAALGMSTVDELQHRLEEDPSAFKNRELMELAQMLLDRTVAPPTGARGSNGTVPGPGLNINIVFKEPTQGATIIDVSPEKPAA